MNTLKAIPKIIHYCWLSGDEIPVSLKECMDTWTKVMPEYQIICWDMKQFDIHSVKFVEQACSVKKWAFAADYIRLYALYTYGGVYLDSDVKVFRKFDEFLNNSAFTSVESYFYTPDRKDDYWMDAAMIGSAKGNPFIKECLDYYEERPFILPDGTYDQTIICHIMSNIAEKKYEFKKNIFVNRPLYLKDKVMTLYPPYVFSHVKGDIRKQTCAIHLVKGSWRKDKKQKYNILNLITEWACKLLGDKQWGIFYFKLKRIMKRNS